MSLSLQSGIAGEGIPDQYGVAGHPVAHSWSPFIHGMFAKSTAQHLVYRLFDITPDDFRRDVLKLFTSGVRGLNVTLPHKQAAAELVNELTPRASRAQAVNTIAFFEDTTLLGDNTDGLGLTSDLERNMKMELADKRLLILGAGGAVRGVLGPLLEREVREVIIANRTAAKAQNLAAEFADLGAVSGCGFSEIGGPAYDLIINATSAGLQGNMPELPDGLVGEETVCYDMAYGRGQTPFTSWATSQHAARACKGWGMLVEQAAESFLLWRGIRPHTQPVLDALAQHI
ncbi:MAG: shikimate dehydrogenase [Gammaproteobacteria bacterium]|nr:shikimate dehydrogenase [Gammaproteobacteria bacterium]